MIGDAAMILAAALAAAAAAGAVWTIMRIRFARERRRLETLEHADAERARLGRMLENLADAFISFTPAGEVGYANRQAEQLLGDAVKVLFGADEAGPVHRQLRVTIHEHEDGELGSERVLIDRWLEAHAYPSAEGISVYLHDNTARRRQEERIRQQSLIDELTGLYNRRGFLTLAEHHLKLAERTGRNVLLLYADLDDFKEINDRYGHHEGDRALSECARALRRVFRDSDVIARIGGDEFAILALETSDVSGDLLARRLREAMDQRNQRQQRGYELTLSLGIARYDARSPATVADLLARADALMYEHKRGKDAARARAPGVLDIVRPSVPPGMKRLTRSPANPVRDP